LFEGEELGRSKAGLQQVVVVGHECLWGSGLGEAAMGRRELTSGES
jgi:hypothetical protein